jgi:hypothetical protein
MLRQGHDRGELGLGQLGQLFTWLSSLIDLGNLERLLLDFLEPSCWLWVISYIYIWVCLKMGYTPNYSNLVGIMIINHWVMSYKLYVLYWLVSRRCFIEIFRSREQFGSSRIRFMMRWSSTKLHCARSQAFRPFFLWLNSWLSGQFQVGRVHWFSLEHWNDMWVWVNTY